MDSFVQGIERLIEHAPDTTMGDIGERVRSRSTVAWVPVELPPPDIEVLHIRDNDVPKTILWPHRWEHDKGPDQLLEVARKYKGELNLRWIILGQQFKEVPEALETFQSEFADDIDHTGFVESKLEYWNWLAKADWVLSTAQHEFFGILLFQKI